jgi:DNA-binding MarR family transcriptional regulator
MPCTADECAAQVMETVPLVMRTIRGHMDTRKPSEISIWQFRAMIFLMKREGASLSALAGHMGVTLPAMSKMVDGLVKRKLLQRLASEDDRRMVTLSLTDAGKDTLQQARQATRDGLAAALKDIPEDLLGQVRSALEVLCEAFGGSAGGVSQGTASGSQDNEGTGN